MTPPERNSRRRLLMFCSGIGLLAVALSLALVASCRRSPTSTVNPGKAGHTEEALESALDALYKGTDLNSCRGAIQQINVYVTHAVEKRPAELTDSERDLRQKMFDLDTDELTEVASPTFTLLDAHYLDSCFLFRDVARSLEVQGLPRKEQAAAAFAWAVRQVRLQEGQEELVPPHLVVRRGVGTSLERAVVFLALLNQLGMEGCLVLSRDDTEGRPTLWAAGALADGELLLFDPRLGMALPGPKGEGIVTLAELRKQPELLGQLTVDRQYPYDMTPEQVRRVEVHLVCPLTALAPRMRFLESAFSADNKVSLAADPSALLERIRKATGEPALEVRVLKEATQALRAFLPPAEGGNDPKHPFALHSLPGFTDPGDDFVTTLHRRQMFELSLVSWNALPPQIRALSPSGELGLHLRDTYGELFMRYPLPPPPRDEHGSGAEGRAEEAQRVRLIDRFIYWFLTAQARQARSIEPAVHHSLSPGSPRDLMLRGRLDDATARLVETEEQVRFQWELVHPDHGLDQKLTHWCERARAAHAGVIIAKAEVEKNDNEHTRAILEEARRKVNESWSDGLNNAPPVQEGEGPAQTRPALWGPLPVWLVALLGAAAGPMGDEVDYLLALGKHEQAERIQARLRAGADPEAAKSAQEAWKAAAELWKTYLNHDPAPPAAGAARTMLARALIALGEKDEARAQLEKLDSLTDLEKAARIYQLRQLRP